jgi:hypothetical protein
LQFLAGDVIRSCVNLNGVLPHFDHNEYKTLPNRLPGRREVVIIHNMCNDRVLRNGSGRLAEISAMMILLPSFLGLLTSFKAMISYKQYIYIYIYIYIYNVMKIASKNKQPSQDTFNAVEKVIKFVV